MSITLPPLPIYPDLPEAIYLMNADELRARDIEVARVVLEAAARHIVDGGQFGETRKRIAMRVRALEIKHD